MGFVLCHGTCAVCKHLCSFNPIKVPSVVVDGTREPICRPCVEAANPVRVQRGLPPIEILPGAYDACNEEELC